MHLPGGLLLYTGDKITDVMGYYRNLFRILFVICVCVTFLFYSDPVGVFANDEVTFEPTSKDVLMERFGGSNGVLVKFKNRKVGAEYLATREQDMVKINNHIKGIDVWLVKSDGISDQALLEQIEANDAVLWAELNGLMHITAEPPKDPYYPGYQENLRVIEMPNAWGISTGTDNVIAIIDTGIDLSHADLANKIWQNSDEIPGNGIDDDYNGYIDDIRGWDFVNNDNLPQDDHWHGSHVGGIAAAETDNLIGIAGVSWGAKLMPLKACNFGGDCYFSDAANAVTYAVDNGSKVVNMSFGSSAPSSVIEESVKYASNLGCILISSVGNENTAVFYPAKYQEVLGIAAADNTDKRWSYSNYGNEVDITAPGVSIVSTVLNDTTGYEYAPATGTSMSAPHISGVVSLIWSVNPLLTADQVKHVLLSTAVDISDPGFDIYTGYGRVDAYAALAYALGNLPDMHKMYLPLFQDNSHDTK